MLWSVLLIAVTFDSLVIPASGNNGDDFGSGSEDTYSLLFPMSSDIELPMTSAMSTVTSQSEPASMTQTHSPILSPTRSPSRNVTRNVVATAVSMSALNTLGAATTKTLESSLGADMTPAPLPHSTAASPAVTMSAFSSPQDGSRVFQTSPGVPDRQDDDTIPTLYYAIAGGVCGLLVCIIICGFVIAIICCRMGGRRKVPGSATGIVASGSSGEIAVQLQLVSPDGEEVGPSTETTSATLPLAQCAIAGGETEATPSGDENASAATQADKIDGAEPKKEVGTNKVDLDPEFITLGTFGLPAVVIESPPADCSTVAKEEQPMPAVTVDQIGESPVLGEDNSTVDQIGEPPVLGEDNSTADEPKENEDK